MDSVNKKYLAPDLKMVRPKSVAKHHFGIKKIVKNDTIGFG